MGFFDSKSKSSTKNTTQLTQVTEDNRVAAGGDSLIDRSTRSESFSQSFGGQVGGNLSLIDPGAADVLREQSRGIAGFLASLGDAFSGRADLGTRPGSGLVEPGPPPASGAMNLGRALPWILGAIASVVVLGGAVVLARRKRRG